MTIKKFMKILGTGLSGMVGSYLIKRLSPGFEFENLSLETGVDITNPETVDRFFSASDASWVLHLAAITDVDYAEQDKDMGEKGKTWSVNVGATEILVAACRKYQKKLLYISTDFVFPGGEKVFREEDAPSPIGWYATTKYEGEKRVGTLDDQGLIVRISFPYGPTEGAKKDFVGKIRERFESKQPIVSPVDQIFVPTYLEDIAKGIETLIQHDASGIYHVVGSEAISSYEATILIADVFNYDKDIVSQTTAAAFYSGRAPRAFHMVISNDRIAELGVKPVDFRAGLNLLKVSLDGKSN